jgi:RHS repeat-associated protein
MTRYAYDPHTFRLKRLRSERYSKPDDLSYHPSGDALQDFGYDYDLIGNILSIQDRTPGSGFLNNPEALTVGDPALAQLLVSGNALNRRFDYDPIYRLLSATGRECDRPPDGEPWGDQPRCTDLTKARAYTETYRYDAMGNMLRLEHRNEPGGFTREYMVETVNNRLRRMQIGQAGYDYTFDVNGNMRSETTSRHFEWNQSDQMKVFRTQTDGAEPSVHAHYLYDSAGQRVKKFVRKQGGRVEVTHYIDGVFEHHRWGNGAHAIENNHVHVMDDKRRIALVRLGPAHPDDRGPAVQFHLGDHLGSSNVVLDSAGALVNREEFTPYGETSFGSFARKRYRFAGNERDEETGFNHHGARYYAAWLARWTRCDPLGLVAGINLYAYVKANPISFVDPQGTDVRNTDADELKRIQKNNIEAAAALEREQAELREEARKELLVPLQVDAAVKDVLANLAIVRLREATIKAEESAKTARLAARFSAGAQAVFHGLETVVACPAAETGIGAVGCVHGITSLHADVNTVLSGEPTPNPFHQVGYGTAKLLGADEKTANLAGTFTDTLGGLASAYATSPRGGALPRSRPLSAPSGPGGDAPPRSNGGAGGGGPSGNGPPSTPSEPLFGPYRHGLNKGGLNDIVTNQRLLSTEAATIAGNEARVRALTGTAGTDVRYGTGTMIEFYTNSAPDWINKPQGWVGWTMPAGEYLPIKNITVFMSAD